MDRRMDWKTAYPQTVQPTMEQIDAYADTPLWPELRAFLAEAYGSAPTVEYSRCGLEPGWNVKFKKGSKALCTVYIRSGGVTAMVSIGAKDEDAARHALLTCTEYTRLLYARTAASKMGRWLMIDVTSPEILEDVKALLAVRAAPAKRA